MNAVTLAGPKPGASVRTVEREDGSLEIYGVDAAGNNVGQAALALVPNGDGRWKVKRYGNGAESVVVLADDGKTHIDGLTTEA